MRSGFCPSCVNLNRLYASSEEDAFLHDVNDCVRRWSLASPAGLYVLWCFRQQRVMLYISPAPSQCFKVNALKSNHPHVSAIHRLFFYRHHLIWLSTSPVAHASWSGQQCKI